MGSKRSRQARTGKDRGSEGGPAEFTLRQVLSARPYNWEGLGGEGESSDDEEKTENEEQTQNEEV